MSRMPLEGWVVLLAVAVTTGLVVASRAVVPGPPRRMALPTASELVEMERYLDPVAVDAGTQVGVPPPVEVDGSPFGRVMVPEPTGSMGPSGPDAEPTRPAPRWVVTAIMITGARRVAVLNDALVRPGDRLNDGARVVAVEQDHVVLITPDGQRRRLEMKR